MSMLDVARHRVGLDDGDPTSEIDYLLGAFGARFRASTIGTGDDQAPPNVNDPDGDPAQLGTTSGVDVNDPGAIEHTGHFVRFVNGTVGNSLRKTADMATTTVAVTRLEMVRRAATTSVSGRFVTHVGAGPAERFYWGFAAAELSLVLSAADDGAATTVALAEAAANTHVSYAIEVEWDAVATDTPTVSFFYSDATGDDDPVWELAGTADAAEAVLRPDGAANFDLGNLASTFTMDGDVRWFRVYNDAVEVESLRMEPSTQIDTSTDIDAGQTSFGGWTVNRAATGYRTAVVTAAEWNFGQLHQIVIPAEHTPTIQADTGTYSGLILLRHHVDSATAVEHLYSSESVSNHGIKVFVPPATFGAGAVGRLALRLGGASAFGTLYATDLPKVTDSRLHLVYFEIVDGVARIALDGVFSEQSLTAPAAGTITHLPPRVGMSAYVIGTGNGYADSIFDVLLMPDRILTRTQIIAIRNRLGIA